MTAQLVEIFVVSIVIMGMATFLILWTLDNVNSEAIKIGAIIVYGFSIVSTLGKLFIEIIKANF